MWNWSSLQVLTASTCASSGWDGDQLAWESRREPDAGVDHHYRPILGTARTTHYLYEPGSFIPLAQAIRHAGMKLQREPVYSGDYDIDNDPLWTQPPTPQPIDTLAWYQCDHLGTPQELTDASGEIAWSAQYKAWGAAQEAISDAARKAGIQNPLRFQGQYYDHETGLHYNRHRYYDPVSGRFISKDPIGLLGGLNLHLYAVNPVEWVDPLGLAKAPGSAGRKPISSKPNQNSRCLCRRKWEVNHFDRICEARLNGMQVKYFRDPTTVLWWSSDTEGHGGSAWKVMRQVGEHLEHVDDADIYGDYMDKHKGGVGKKMSMKSMKCRNGSGEGRN